MIYFGLHVSVAGVETPRKFLSAGKRLVGDRDGSKDGESGDLKFGREDGCKNVGRAVLGNSLSSDGAAVGVRVGVRGASVGIDDGWALGVDDGTSVGVDDGVTVGTDDGMTEGIDDGVSLGIDDGTVVGTDDGVSLGIDDGTSVGTDDGM